MKNILLIILLVFWGALPARAAALGPEVEVIQRDGKPRLGVQYSYEANAVSWNLMATVATSSLPAGRPLFARVYDLAGEAYLSGWLPLDLGTGISNEEVLSLSLDRNSSLQTLRAFPNVALVFSADQNTLAANLSFAPLCASNPESFADLTLGRSGCAPDKSMLSALPEKVGGLCNNDLHKKYCSRSFDAVRDAIARQQQCYFKCK